jgi:1,4-alpha-glucan branching enzyme
MMQTGYLAIILHAHLPFVRHPEHPSFLEEDWLFEAITESYIPLILALQRLLEEGIRARITLSISPPLLEMLADPLLQSRYNRYLGQRLDLCQREVRRTAHQPEFHMLALMYLDQFQAALTLFEDRCHKQLASAFRELAQQQALEIITCSATHALLPFISRPEARKAQLEVARATHQKHLGATPTGLWLAECGYEPGVEQLLKESGFNFFVLDTHGLLFGNPRPPTALYAPVETSCGVIAFGRDIESSWQVWNLHHGYPGDCCYREFYRDLGYDGDYETIKPFLHADGVRRNLGIKYFRISGGGDLSQREPYDPAMARQRSGEHAAHFISQRTEQVRQVRDSLGITPIIIAPYDAELFGHWWYEGPPFLEAVCRQSATGHPNFRMVTLSEYLSENPSHFRQQPAASTWGAEGYNRVWLNRGNQWLYRHQHWAEERMVQLANTYSEAEGQLLQMLNQAARELLLAQSSDWAFIISHNTSPSYAIQRFRSHIDRFNHLYEAIMANTIESDWLETIAQRDTIFPDLDYRVFRSPGCTSRPARPTQAVLALRRKEVEVPIDKPPDREESP